MAALRMSLGSFGMATPATSAAKRMVCCLSLIALLSLASSRGLAANWTKLTNTAPTQIALMVQMTDGTILAQTYSQTWVKLTPDAHGSYINGTWSTIAPEPVARLYVASQILPNGNLWVLGGEYSGPGLQPNWSNTGEIYDPVANTWKSITPFPSQPNCPAIHVMSGNVTVGTNQITAIYPYTSGLVVGWGVSGTGIPVGATIVSIDSTTQITISANATATRTADSLTFNHSFRLTACVGDEPSMLLPGGKILVGDLLNANTYIYDIDTDSWAQSGTKVYSDSSDEEGWAMLADGTILTYDLFKSVATLGSYAERYNPVTGTWSSTSPSDGTAAGTIPQLSSAALGSELGPILRLQDGRLLVIGATQHTALYDPSTTPVPTWTPGSDIIGTVSGNTIPFGADDAPAAILPNGHVIIAADTGPSVSTFSAPTQLFDFNPGTGAITPLTPTIPDTNLATESAYLTRMLVLPTGQMLFSDSSSQVWAYTPDGGANPALRPVINGITYAGGGRFTLTGKQLNGQSAGAAYGDDAQMDSNYPIIRMTNFSGGVFYARSTNWSSVGVAGGSTPETVDFTLNPTLTPGNYTVVVSGAGIASFPAMINITQAEVNKQ